MCVCRVLHQFRVLQCSTALLQLSHGNMSDLFLWLRPALVLSAWHAGGLPGLKDGGMVDRVGLSAWRERRRQQHERQHGRPVSSSTSLPPCLVHIIERSSPFSGADDAEASGEERVQFVRCPKSGVNFFDLGDFERQFDIAKQRANTNLKSYLSSSHRQVAGTSKQAQQLLAGSSGQPQQQQTRSSVVLPSARRSAAAAAAVAGPGSNNRRSTSSISPS
jgi:hypothetical protein